MDPKKAPQVSLENRRLTNTIIGLIISLSLVLVSFEWTTPQDQRSELAAAKEIEIDMQEVALIPREEPKPEPEEPLPAVEKIIDIVPDDVELEDLDFIYEVTHDIEYDFRTVNGDETEQIVEAPIPFVLVQEKPEFNGGDPNKEFARYIARNLQYPAIAAENGVDGLVIVRFIIDEEGNLINPMILRSVDPALDAEALRVISASPRWTPGKQRNKPAKVAFSFPIHFILQ